MPLETKVYSLITKVRTDLRELKTTVDDLEANGIPSGSATETSSGIIELATQTETNTGTDDARAITPLKFQTRLAAYAQPLAANLTSLAGQASTAYGRALLNLADQAALTTAIRVATETVTGISRFATQAETNSGTLDTVVVTPLKFQTRLAAYAQPLAANLTTLAGITPGATGQSLLAAATAAAAKATLGLAAVATSGSASDITTGTLPTSVMPPLSINEVFPVASQAAMLALTAQRGDMAIRSDLNRTFVLSTDDPTVLANWSQVTAGGDVTSVAGRIGAVSLTKADVGLGNVDNVADASKPVSGPQQTALNLKADLASPSLTGTPTAPTASPGTNTTQLSTTAFVAAAISAYAQPLSANLTTLAGVVSGAMGRTLLAAADAAAAKTALSLVKADVGLGNVDNTSDVNKPVSTATQTALNAKLGSTAKAADSDLLDGFDSSAFIRSHTTATQLTDPSCVLITTANQTLASGIYNLTGTNTNGPWGNSDTRWWFLEVIAHVNNNGWSRQIAWDMTGGTDFMYTRRGSDAGGGTTVWTSWVLVVPPAASETVSGIMELATQTETNTGTDDLRAVTPLKFQTRLAAYAQPLSSNLTTLAGVVSGAMGRTLLAAADAAAAKSALSLVKADVGLGNVDNTSDTNKPVSTATQTALDLKANLASPALTGNPTAPTQTVGDNSTRLATTAFVSSSVAAGLPAVIDGGTP